MGAKRQRRQPHHQQMHERKGRSWTGPVNVQLNAQHMRQDYLRMTAKLILEHGENCFARFNLNIPSGV